ncbi:DAK2 domain-containing protein [Heliorestis convoluta]|uniref:DAK2 domain-containing protein n=1 Tax=Heliorestis convoluta TaxID=356322 RepID=A0A5Q2N756_9FIRM|nr:DAK2 domain-containing protein [Heliorestis convoluta]QGG48100.1 DAK2 domain-containing protein [Heliorestis convoluta]
MSTASKSPKDRRVALRGNDVIRLLQGGAFYVAQKKDIIDRLNVFPVPDGDTGTNLSLTLQSAVASLPVDEDHVGKVAALTAKGALLGARGNSGVIFSQLIWGWAKELEKKKVVTAQDWAGGMVKGVELAYSAVMKPVEGTILTVSKAAALAAQKAAKRGHSFDEVFMKAIEAGQEALARTPELLPILKEANVVDAGGQGYLFFLQGSYKALQGETWEDAGAVEFVEEDWQKRERFHQKIEEATHFTYCTEFIVRGQALPIQVLRHSLEKYGDSVLVVGDATVAKCHVHTDRPWLALEKGGLYGTLHEISISNMKDQRREKESLLVDKVSLAMIASAPSEGWAQLLRKQGVRAIVSGGSTCNPSAQDWVRAIEEAGTTFAILLPNHSNLILAARQAVQMIGADRALVVPTKNLASGLAAAFQFEPEKSIEDNMKAMSQGYEALRYAEITRAVRDVTIHGIEVKEGQLLGLYDHKVVASGTVMEEVIVQTIQQERDDWELISLYTGEGLEKQEIENVIAVLEEHFPDAEIEQFETGQPLYPYLIGLE